MDIEERNVLNVYNIIAKHFDKTRLFKWSWIEEFLKNYDVEKETLCDIGCGSGRNLQKNIIGIDNCDSFLNICRIKGHHVKKGCMTSLPLFDRSCDAILSIASFHHLSTRERRIKCLLEMKRVLKDNKPDKNKILLSVWSKKQPKNIKRFFEYGDNIVPWNNNGTIYERYYYIFRHNELLELYKEVGLKVFEYKWDCGNEIYILGHSYC